jgi:hypothetical protein
MIGIALAIMVVRYVCVFDTRIVSYRVYVCRVTLVSILSSRGVHTKQLLTNCSSFLPTVPGSAPLPCHYSGRFLNIRALLRRMRWVAPFLGRTQDTLLTMYNGYNVCADG